MIRKCFRCDVKIPAPSISEAIEMERRFREAFPITWEDEMGRALVCQTCYDEMEEESPKEKWEIDNL